MFGWSFLLWEKCHRASYISAPSENLGNFMQKMLTPNAAKRNILASQIAYSNLRKSRMRAQMTVEDGFVYVLYHLSNFIA